MNRCDTRHLDLLQNCRTPSDAVGASLYHYAMSAPIADVLGEDFFANSAIRFRPGDEIWVTSYFGDTLMKGELVGTQAGETEEGALTVTVDWKQNLLAASATEGVLGIPAGPKKASQKTPRKRAAKKK